ncbi:hypothetical protein FACS1894218_0850 [Bacilli bacterium]|nr:hypothetical protein FACS1894218_0850 [Bacilli bacterium]
MANAAANKMIEEAYPGVTNFNWNAELTLKYFVVGKKFDVYFSGNGQDVNIGTDKLQFSYQLKNYRIEYAFTNEINNHNNFHLTISKKDKTHFEKYAYNTGAYTQSEVSTRPKDVGAHSLDDIGTII